MKVYMSLVMIACLAFSGCNGGQKESLNETATLLKEYENLEAELTELTVKQAAIINKNLGLIESSEVKELTIRMQTRLDRMDAISTELRNAEKSQDGAFYKYRRTH